MNTAQQVADAITTDMQDPMFEGASVHSGTNGRVLIMLADGTDWLISVYRSHPEVRGMVNALGSMLEPPGGTARADSAGEEAGIEHDA